MLFVVGHILRPNLAVPQLGVFMRRRHPLSVLVIFSKGSAGNMEIWPGGSGLERVKLSSSTICCMVMATALGSLVDITIYMLSRYLFSCHTQWLAQQQLQLTIWTCMLIFHLYSQVLALLRKILYLEKDQLGPVLDVSPMLMLYYVWHKVLHAMFQWLTIP